jgi:putative transposase
LQQYYSYGGETLRQRTALQQGIRELMSTIIRPLAELLTTMDIGDGSGRTAGPSFEFYYDYELPIHPSNRWTRLLEMFSELSSAIGFLAEDTFSTDFVKKRIKQISEDVSMLRGSIAALVGDVISWHRAAFRRFWRWKSRPSGRPRLPADIRMVIRRMAAENPTWGEERIADELLLKLGLWVSPRTVGKYLKQQPRPRGSRDQRWSTFVRNHADAIVACDFFVSITARFRILYVFVAMEIGSRRILHFNVTEHPTAEWTLQQLRETLPGDHSYRFLLHDRQGSFSTELDDQIQDLGVRVLRSPVGAPTANAHCERLIGSMRRECLDFLIPIDEWHLRRTLRQWSTHYNCGRPHRALGPGIPDAPDRKLPVCDRRYEIPVGSRLASKPVLGGLHHEYCWENNAA